MMIKNLLALIVVFFAIGFTAFGQEELFVTAPNGIICRSAPSISSVRVGTVPYGAVVELIERTDVPFEMMDNDQKISGYWVKVQVSYSAYFYSLLSKTSDGGYWYECYVFDGYLEPLNKAKILMEEIDQKDFERLQSQHGSPKTEIVKIEDYYSIEQMIGARATWIEDYDSDLLLLDSLLLPNGKRYKINEDYNECNVVAYFPSEDVLLFKGGHESDFSISLKTGESIETVGNPDYIINSPNKKLRLNGHFPGQECSSYFFQEIDDGELKYLVDFGWGSIYGDKVCNFQTFFWIDDTHFAYSFLDYSSNSETGDWIYCKAEILPLNGLDREVSQSKDFLKVEKINEKYSVAYEHRDPEFDAYYGIWIISSDDTVWVEEIETNMCSLKSVSPNGEYAVISTCIIRMDRYSETDSMLYFKSHAILVDLSTAEIVQRCPNDCGINWNENNQWMNGTEVIFDASVSPMAPFDTYYISTDSTQIYDYSNLWDFDGDGTNDSLLFIGDGGAHLHFYPRFVLSSNSKVYELTSFWLDMPYPDRKKGGIFKSPAIQIVVDNFDDDKAYEIYLNIDGNNGYAYGNSYPKEWRKFGLSTTYVLLNFEKGTLILKDYGF